MKEDIWQSVDERDRLLGDVPSGRAMESAEIIHRRVAVLLRDEDGRGLFWKTGSSWDLPSRPVLAEESSGDAARALLAELGLHSEIEAAGGILLLQDRGSSQTHLFLGIWNGAPPKIPTGATRWGKYFTPPGSGAYRECSTALLKAMRKGHTPSVRIRKDMRKKS